MQTAFSPAIARAAVAALGILVALPAAHAAAVVGTPAAFSVSTEVMDQEGGTSTTRTNLALGSVNLQRFDSSLGVLTGATVRVTGQRTQAVAISAQGNAFAKSTTGSGSSTARVEAPGTAITFGQISATGSCTAARNCASITEAPATATTASVNVAAAQLGSWAGPGEVNLSLWAPLLTATQLTNSFTGVERTTYGLQWTGAVSVDYSYLLHALPSFDGGRQTEWEIDFGTQLLGAAAGPRAFRLFNGSGDRLSLDLDDIVGDGDTSILQTDLTRFADLGADGSLAFLAFFDTGVEGDYEARYRLSLSNTGSGAQAGIDPVSTLWLTLRGRVEGGATAPMQVPEPGSLPLVVMGAAALLLARGSRRR